MKSFYDLSGVTFVVVTGGETQGAWKMISGMRRGKGTVSVDEWR